MLATEEQIKNKEDFLYPNIASEHFFSDYLFELLSNILTVPSCCSNVVCEVIHRKNAAQIISLLQVGYFITFSSVRLVIVWISVFGCLGAAQLIDWTREIGTPYPDYGWGVSASADGMYIYVAGLAEGSLNDQPSSGGR